MRVSSGWGNKKEVFESVIVTWMRQFQSAGPSFFAYSDTVMLANSGSKL
jgi:hypothetical protein